ncbi:MAG: bifunctional folylpolyglutamate synthase/dihydrofolate synthase [Spirochaetes bacterium]|jgi:dihydrofolate synthase/folylpolyglutamate synthase|nr:bifunctional folylpolyglutamate synthase/dihydrofolate synthase [Spirochaetota bacterium]
MDKQKADTDSGGAPQGASHALDPRRPELTELFAYIESFTNVERGSYLPRVFRLHRMRRLLALFGNPHRQLRCVHIAGSKGKGSTATLIASILNEAGFHTGLYTSPHVVRYEERITLAGVFFPQATYRAAGERIRRVVEDELRPTLPETELPSTFELLTLMAFLIFHDAGVDYAVLETGLGGRLDATNVVDPVAAVLTPIELEHTEYLGNTVTEIAREKAAILKPGRLAFIGLQNAEAEAAIRARLQGIGVQATWLRSWRRRFESVSTLEGNRVRIEGASRDAEAKKRRPRALRPVTESAAVHVRTTLSLLGRVHGDNASLAALVTTSLEPELDEATVSRGLAAARLLGRGEIVPAGVAKQEPGSIDLPCPAILDGAHTPASVRAMTDMLTELGARRCVVIFGSVLGKNHRDMLTSLARICEQLIIARPGTFKKSDLSALQETAEQLEMPVVVEPAAQAAVSIAVKNARDCGADAILVIGSFYLLGEIRPLIRV